MKNEAGPPWRSRVNLRSPQVKTNLFKVTAHAIAHSPIKHLSVFVQHEVVSISGKGYTVQEEVRRNERV
jgi:hypothetical protein